MQFALVIALAASLAYGERPMQPRQGDDFGMIGVNVATTQAPSATVAAVNKFSNSTRVAAAMETQSTSDDMRNFKFHGCETHVEGDSKYVLVSVSTDMTPDHCAHLCGPNRALFATSEDRCFCGDALDAGSKAVDPSNCRSACLGDPAQTCGEERIVTPSEDGAEAGVPTFLSVFTQKSSSDTLNDKINNANSNTDTNVKTQVNTTTTMLVSPFGMNTTRPDQGFHALNHPAATPKCAGANCRAFPSAVAMSGVSKAETGSLAFLGVFSLLLQALL